MIRRSARAGLRGMFGADPRFEVVGEAADGAAAITTGEKLRPDVILMDRRMRRPPGDRSGGHRISAEGSRAAEQLFISQATVKTHLLHVYAKLVVNDRAMAVAAAFVHGYLTV